MSTKRLNHFKKRRRDSGPELHESGGTYCGSCGLFIKSGRIKYFLGGRYYHHHCARYLPEPPPQTVCAVEGCRTATSCRLEDPDDPESQMVVLPVCWLHSRGDWIQKGRGLAGDLMRRREALLGVEAEEAAWLRRRGFHEHGSVVDGSL